MPIVVLATREYSKNLCQSYREIMGVFLAWLSKRPLLNHSLTRIIIYFRHFQVDASSNHSTSPKPKFVAPRFERKWLETQTTSASRHSDELNLNNAGEKNTPFDSCNSINNELPSVKKTTNTSNRINRADFEESLKYASSASNRNPVSFSNAVLVGNTHNTNTNKLETTSLNRLPTTSIEASHANNSYSNNNSKANYSNSKRIYHHNSNNTSPTNMAQSNAYTNSYNTNNQIAGYSQPPQQHQQNGSFYNYKQRKPVQNYVIKFNKQQQQQQQQHQTVPKVANSYANNENYMQYSQANNNNSYYNGNNSHKNATSYGNTHYNANSCYSNVNNKYRSNANAANAMPRLNIVRA